MKISKKKLLSISLVALAVLLVGSFTWALLKNSSNKVQNTFIAGEVGCEIHEDIETTEGTKKDVFLKNTGNATGYLRACVVISWVDESGNISDNVPVEGTDYEISVPEKWNWFKDGDFYYFKNSVKAGDSTDNLFDAVSVVPTGAETGLTLSVEILGSAIQYEPASVVESNWNVTVNSDGTLSKKGE